MMCSNYGRRFATLRFWVREVRMNPCDSSPVGSYQLPIDTYGISLTIFELFSYLQSVSAHPPVRPGYNDRYRSRSYRFVERQKSVVTLYDTAHSVCLWYGQVRSDAMNSRKALSDSLIRRPQIEQIIKWGW